MSKQLRLKVYGAVKGEKRILRKGHYYAETRDKLGRFKKFRKWSPKRPVKPERYLEKYVEAKTGLEARTKVAEAVTEEVWIKKKVEYW